MMAWAGPIWGSLRPVDLEQTEGNSVRGTWRKRSRKDLHIRHVRPRYFHAGDTGNLMEGIKKKSDIWFMFLKDPSRGYVETRLGQLWKWGDLVRKWWWLGLGGWYQQWRYMHGYVLHAGCRQHVLLGRLWTWGTCPSSWGEQFLSWATVCSAAISRERKCW